MSVRYTFFLLFSFAGFAEESLQPAPQLGFNLTFRCPEGMKGDYIVGIVYNNTNIDPLKLDI